VEKQKTKIKRYGNSIFLCSEESYCVMKLMIQENNDNIDGDIFNRKLERL
jgi:hypothetical protein